MALHKMKVQRNLQAKIRWFFFEVEDLILLGLLWVGTELGSNLLDRTIFDVPAEVILPWIVVVLAYVALRVFKYNKPPAYLFDVLEYHRLPRLYCACEPDPIPVRRYLREHN